MFVRSIGTNTGTATSTYTIVETPEEPELIPLRLRLRPDEEPAAATPLKQTNAEEKAPPQELTEPSTEDKLKALLADMKRPSGNDDDSSPSPQAQMISEWAARYFKKYQTTSSVPAEQERAARALCFLLSNTPDPLSPAITARLHAIIAETLPKNRDVSRFIRVYMKKEALFLLKRLEDSLYSRANRVNDALILQFEAVKKELLTLNTERQQAATTLYERLDAVDARINQLTREMQAIHQKMGQVERSIGAQQQTLETALTQCDQLRSTVK